MAKKDSKDPDQPGRFKQLLQAFRLVRQRDKLIGLKLLGIFVLVAGVVFVVLALLLHWLYGIVIGVPSGLLVTMIYFGRRAERAAYAQFEGQPGAAAAGLSVLKRGWNVKPGIAFTKQQDMVHRVVGRPGIVLVGEGNPNRIRSLLASEKKKHARIADEVPIYDLICGEGEGEISVRKISKAVMKLPRNLKPADVTDVLQRLRALDAMRPQVPMPKGPMPTNPRAAKAAARQAMRGR